MLTAVHELEDRDAEFFDLVYADEDLLDAEFEALVADLGPPPSTPPRFPEPLGHRGVRGRPADADPRASGPSRMLTPQPTGRERSPPR